MKKIKISILIIAVLLMGILCPYSNAATTVSGTSDEPEVPEGTYIIRSSIDKDYVIDVANGSTANGANIQLYKYDKSTKQQFNVSYLGSGLYKILAVHSNKSLDVKDASTKIGANVQQWE